MKIQPKTKQPKVPISPRVLSSINHEIERTAKKFNVSKSWVVAVALGDQFGIDVISYIEAKPKLRMVR